MTQNKYARTAMPNVFPMIGVQPTDTGGGNQAHMKEYCELCRRGQLCTYAPNAKKPLLRYRRVTQN